MFLKYIGAFLLSERDADFFIFDPRPNVYGRNRRIDLEDKAKVVASDWETKSLPR